MSKTTEINTITRLQRSPSQISCRVDAEEILMSIENGKYYNLNPVATEVWDLLDQPKTVEEIADVKMQDYKVDRELCVNEILTLMTRLRAEGLVEATV